jgi:thioesterase domain-containing protein
VSRRAEAAGTLVHGFGADPKTAGTLVVLLHPGSLPTSVYARLAEAIPAEASLLVADLERIPCYWQGALRAGEPEVSVAELVERVGMALPPSAHRRLIVAGWSFGGVVAHAIAANVEAERVILLDSIAAVDAFADAEETLTDGEVLRWFAMYLAAKRGRPLKLASDSLEGASALEGLALLLDAGLAGGLLLRGTTLAGLRKVYTTYLAGLRRNQRLALDHTPVQAQVPLHLIKPSGSLMPDSPTLGWDELAGAGLAVHRCGGDHYTMVQDPDAIAIVAALLHTEHQLDGAPLAGACTGGLR